MHDGTPQPHNIPPARPSVPHDHAPVHVHQVSRLFEGVTLEKTAHVVHLAVPRPALKLIHYRQPTF